MVIGLMYNIYLYMIGRHGVLVNIIGVILNIKRGMYKIGTRGRILQQNWLLLNAFEKTNFKGRLQENVPNVK